MIAVFQRLIHEEETGGEFEYDQLVTVFDTQLQVDEFLKHLGKKTKDFFYLEIEKGEPLPGTGFSFATVYDVDWVDKKVGKTLKSGYEHRNLDDHQWIRQNGQPVTSLKLGDKVNDINLHQPGYDPALAQEHVDLMMQTLKVKRLKVTLGEVVRSL